MHKWVDAERQRITRTKRAPFNWLQKSFTICKKGYKMSLDSNKNNVVGLLIGSIIIWYSNDVAVCGGTVYNVQNTIWPHTTINDSFFSFSFLYLYLGRKSLFQTSHVGFFCFSLHSTFESMHCPKIYCIPLFSRTIISTFRKKQLETINGKTYIVHPFISRFHIIHNSK